MREEFLAFLKQYGVIGLAIAVWFSKKVLRQETVLKV
jgi:hypothetical protein